MHIKAKQGKQLGLNILFFMDYQITKDDAPFLILESTK